MAPTRLSNIIDAGVEKRTGSGIEYDRDVLARLVACCLDCFDDELASLLIGLEVWRKFPLIPDRGGISLSLQNLGFPLRLSTRKKKPLSASPGRRGRPRLLHWNVGIAYLPFC